MRVAIITENFLPKLDGVTRTLVRLLEHLQRRGHQALLLGPESGMDYYAGAEVIGTAGLPFPFYPELKFNFFRPLFIRRLNEFDPDIVHLVDPVILGATGLAAGQFLHKPLISSYHTNLAAYCEHFGFSLLTKPMWSYNRFIHNQCTLTFCPSPSTAAMLRLQGFEHLRIWPRGVDTTLFHPGRRSTDVRNSWLQARKQPENKTIILYVGRVSWEKNLNLLIQAYQTMNHEQCHLVIVGDGPAHAEVQQKLAGLPVTFTGYLTGEALATAYASALVPLGRAADAREILQAALNRAIQIGNHRSAAMVQMGLARVNSELGDLDRSDRFLAELEPVLRDMLPPGHEAFGALHQIKSQNFAKRGDYIAALNEATLALGIFSAHPGLMYRAAAVHESMAGILLAMKNLPQAHAEVLQARNTFNAAFGPDAKSYYLGRTWLTEAKIDEVSGERQNARSAAEAAYQHFVASVGETHPLTEEAKALR